jgi:hypothetical protein
MSDDSTYHVAKTPFFDDTDCTQNAIRDVAAATDLVLYVGAGLTIDRGGPTWGQMLDKVSEGLQTALGPEVSQQEPYLSARNFRLLPPKITPVERATMLTQWSHRIHGDPAINVLSAKVADAVYPSAIEQMIGGRLSRALASMIVTFAGAGRRVTVISTNYDNILQSDIETEVKLWRADHPDGRLALDIRFAEPNRSGTLDWKHEDSGITGNLENLISFHYLHGRLRRGHSPDGYFVFNEADYARIRPGETAFLASAFTNRTVLVVGSSISDVALVDALLLSNTSRQKRYATVPVIDLIPDLGSEKPPTECDVEARKKWVNARYVDLGLIPLFPDFHYQVPVLVSEIVRFAKSDATSCKPHKQRLMEWSKLWRQKHGFSRGDDKPAARPLKELHDKLEETVNLLAQMGLLNGSVGAKLELWARWTVADDIRQLRICASSSVIITSNTTRRTIDLSVAAKVPVMIGYCAGRPTMTAAEETKPVGAKEARKSAYSNRWHSRLVVPIVVEYDGSDLAVGAVELSSMEVGAFDRLAQENPTKFVSLVKSLTECGDHWLSLDDTKRRG